MCQPSLAYAVTGWNLGPCALEASTPPTKLHSHLIIFFLVCGNYVCEYVQMYDCMKEYMHVHEVDVKHLPQALSAFYMMVSFLAKPKLVQWARLLDSSGDYSFDMDAGDPNSGPHAFMESAWTDKPSFWHSSTSILSFQCCRWSSGCMHARQGSALPVRALYVTLTNDYKMPIAQTPVWCPSRDITS